MTTLVVFELVLVGIFAFLWSFKIIKSKIEPEWTQWTLEKYYQSKYHQEQSNSISPEISKQLEETEKTVKDNAVIFDKHIIYIAGGAIALLPNFINAIDRAPILRITISLFICSIISTITSYICFGKAERLKAESLSKITSTTEEIDKLYKQGEKVLAEAMWTIFWSKHRQLFYYSYLSSALTISTYLYFVIGLILIIFLIS